MLLLVLSSSFIQAAPPKVDTYELAVIRILVSGPDKQGRGELFGHGTGFFVNSAGYLVTNHHVIDESSFASGPKIEAFYPTTGAKEPATVVWSDRELDLAVLLVSGGKAPQFLKLEEPLVDKGTPVYAVGFPGQNDKESRAAAKVESSIVEGLIANRFKRTWRPSYSRELMILAHSAQTHPGNSGGPLVNECAHVVGVHSSGSYREFAGERVAAYKYASHVSEVIRELRAKNIPIEVATEICDATPAEELNPMSFLNTGAIVLLAALLALMFFRQSRQAVVQGVQKSMVRISSIGKSTAGNPVPAAPGGMALGGGGSAVRPGGSQAAVHSLRLVPLNGAASGMAFELQQHNLTQQKHGVSFGREARIVDNVIGGEGISRRHFRISFEQATYFVEDLNSAGGTQVNQNTLQPYYAEGIKAGDAISAGACQWRVEMT